MKKLIGSLLLALFAAASGSAPASAQSAGYTADEIILEGNAFFGGVTEGLAAIVERAAAQYGLPNGYILGQEGSGALIAGARYGEGTLHTKNAGQHPVFWQGPSIGADIGGSGDRVMMLVYNLPSVDAMFQRFLGAAGTAHVVAGFGMTVLTRDGIYVVPIVSGVGARLGVNVGYLKFTSQPTWNPF
jgi:hypothetical protein